MYLIHFTCSKLKQETNTPPLHQVFSWNFCLKNQNDLKNTQVMTTCNHVSGIILRHKEHIIHILQSTKTDADYCSFSVLHYWAFLISAFH